MTIQDSYGLLLSPVAVGKADEVLDIPAGTGAADALDAFVR
jgi:hypothetical protein